jgi:hypothetical protein
MPDDIRLGEWQIRNGLNLDDKTFRSDLIDVLTKHNIGEISSTSPEIIATSIENHIQGFNLTTVQRDKTKFDLINSLEDELAKYNGSLTK